MHVPLGWIKAHSGFRSQGEAFGYIGSSRIFYDMRQKDGSVFPSSKLGMTIDNITAYIEARQLLKNSADEVYAYYYQPNSETGPSAPANTVLTTITAVRRDCLPRLLLPSHGFFFSFFFPLTYLV